MDNKQLDPQLGGITNGKVPGTLEPTARDNDVDSPWLHAPYNVVVEPLRQDGNTTISGKNYEKTYALYKSIASRTDQTEEASNLRKAWSTPPSVSIDNGKLQLHGTDEFLQSDTADSLRAVFEEMKDNTYTTESLNKQIESWNVELQKMAGEYTEALDGLNAMNYGILTTATGKPRMLTFSDFLRIANNAQIGRDANATNSDKLIFVGYEYKDDGTAEPKYVRAKDFAEEFNSRNDEEGTPLEQRMGGVRQRYSDLVVQANEGDPGAIAKLVYLQGGSESAPANALIDSGETFQGGTDILVLNIMRGLTHGLDAATAWYNILFLNPMGIPRFAGKIKNVFDNAGDWSRFWDSDTVSKMADEMDATVDWYNSFFAQLSPETTKIFATTGGIVGMIAAMGYCITSASIAQEVGAAGIGRAINAASRALEMTGQGVRVSVTVGGAVGRAQQLVSQAGGMVTSAGTTITGAQQVGTTLSIVLPKFVVEHFPGIAQTMVKAAYMTQLGNRGVALAGAASNDIGLFVTEASPSFNALFKGAEVLPGLAGSASTARNVLVLGKEGLRNMRVWSKGFRLALNFTAMGNYLAVKTLDEYFRKTNDGEDMGDIGDYLVTNVAKEAIWAAGFTLAGAAIGKIVDVSRASRVAPTRVVDAAHTISDNSASGFYQNQANEEPITFAQPAEAKDAADYNEIVTLFNSVITVNGEKFFVPNDVTQTVLVPTGNTIATNTGALNGIGVVKNGSAITTRIDPTAGGFNVTTITKDLATGNETSDVKFYDDFDTANNALQKATVPSVNPKTLGNSDLAVSSNIAPLSIDGGLSAVRTLPDGTSRVRIRPDVLYLNPNEFENKVSELLNQFTPEQMVELEGFINTIDLDSLATSVYGAGPEIAAPSLFIPKNIEEMRQLAYNIAVGRAVARYNSPNSVFIPTVVSGGTASYSTEVGGITKATKMPHRFVVMRNGLTKGSFSTIEEAIEYRDSFEGSQIYELDDTAPVLVRPAVTSESLYSPSVRTDSAAGRAPQLAGAAEAAGEAPSSGFDATEHIVKFNDLMLSLPELKDSPTDYTQAIVDISKTVRDVYNGISADVNMEQIYEDYGRQIAEGVEQPTVDDETKRALAPLSHMLEALGRYFDPSGKSLTKGFYLPTGAPGNKLVSLEDILTNPDNIVDADHPVDGSFDDILVDPQRVGDYGFWEKRTGELFRDEDGNFTMAKAGTLEENLMAYTVSALTRGQNRLTVAANNEMAKSRYDKNRHQIDMKSALKGLRDADATRGRIRAAQLGNAKRIKRSLRKEKLQRLKDDYSDENTIKAFDEAYKAKNYADEINYVKDTNEAAKTLGYRGTLTIGNIQGGTLRFGSQGGFKGITNDIRKASRINITGAKTVYRYGEYKTIGFGLSENQKLDYGFVDVEPTVNLGNSVSMMFGTSRASVSLYNELLPEFRNYVQNGGWGLLNSIENFAVQNFPLIDNPHYAANDLFQGLCRNLDAYTDETARWLANQQLTAEWTKKYATANINSAIKMADLSKTDERTIDALNTIMIRALVGSPVHTSTIANGIIKSGVLATLGFNPSPAIGNLINEPIRIIDVYGHPTFIKVVGKMMNPKERGRVKDILGELPSRFDGDSEMVGLAAQAKGLLSRFIERGEKAATWFLTASEDTKNLMFWFAAEENAKKLFPKDKNAQLRHTMRMFNETAIAGGPGTNPGISESTMGRLLFFLRNFTIRNMDDFIENFEQIGRGTSGSRKWGAGKNGWQGEGGGYTRAEGSKKFNWAKATRFAGGYLLRRYLLWLFVLGSLGRSIWDALGGDPTGISDATNRGLYDDEGTDEYEGMTALDNVVNYLPTGFLLGTLKDFYFAARRSGIDTKNFLGVPDFEHDASLQNDLAKHLPFGVAKRRLGDMLQLLDRGYAFNSYGNKMYSAPDNIVDYMKGFMLGRATTSNAIAYNKYRYGSVDTYGDLFSGDWLDFAMGANPFGESRFDSTRSDYTGVFRGGYNDVPTMQAAIADLKERQKAIIDKYNSDLNQYTGDFEGLTKSEREKLAAEKRDQSIKEFTNDVKRLVDAYQEAGNALSDKQINSLMYLFDFKEGDEDTWDSQVAQRRYVEAGLPDTNSAITSAVEEEDKTTGEKGIVEQTPFDRSLVYQNAIQGYYGRPRDAAKEITSTLESFKPTYKSYKERVQDLNDKMYAAKKGSSERKKYSEELEKVQNEYLEKLYTSLDPVIRKYGTGTLSDSAALESLRSYMNGMIPYSSIKKYKMNFPSGNDVVYGQLDDWIKKRWGAAAPTSPSDKEVSDAIKRAKELKDSGKTSQAKAVVREILDRLARGTVSARDEDVQELRNIYYGK